MIRDDDELHSLADLAAKMQMHPESHIGYLGVERDGIAAELADTTWRDVAAVAVDEDVIVGWLIGDVEAPMGRVWWFGPFIVTDDWEHRVPSSARRRRR